MKSTDNYQFNMPEQSDYYDIMHQNDNWEQLDALLKTTTDELSELVGDCNYLAVDIKLEDWSGNDGEYFFRISEETINSKLTTNDYRKRILHAYYFRTDTQTDKFSHYLPYGNADSVEKTLNAPLYIRDFVDGVMIYTEQKPKYFITLVFICDSRTLNPEG